jgi:hypothetical protein
MGPRYLSANHPSGKDHFGFPYDLVDSIEVAEFAFSLARASIHN